MEMRLGKQIAGLRKARGMTQEALARAVGVSAPAVSKWETDASCPDITLLCPLARALGTNVDTLLQFEEQLEEKEAVQICNEALETVRNQELAKGEEMLEEALHTYPSSIPLKYHGSVALEVLPIFCLEASEEKKKDWKARRKELLEEVYESRDPIYWQNAACGLAALAVQEEELERGERLLEELPKYTTDTSILKTQIYLKRDQPEQALEYLQKELYKQVRKIQTTLTLMMNEKIATDGEEMLKLCEVYEEFEELFQTGGGLTAGYFVEAYERIGDEERQKEAMIKMLEQAVQPLKRPNPLLFSKAVSYKENQPIMTKELKKIMLEELKTKEEYQKFFEDEAFRKGMERLEESM